MTDMQADPAQDPQEANPSVEEQSKKNSRLVAGLLVAMVFILPAIAAGLTELLDNRDQYSYQPTVNDRVAEILSGHYHDGYGVITVPLDESSNRMYGGDGSCQLHVLYQPGQDGAQEFATAASGSHCRVSYSVNIFGYYERWVYPDAHVTYMAQPGQPIRGIAFAACAPDQSDLPVLPNPSCTIVKMMLPGAAEVTGEILR